MPHLTGLLTDLTKIKPTGISRFNKLIEAISDLNTKFSDFYISIIHIKTTWKEHILKCNIYSAVLFNFYRKQFLVWGTENLSQEWNMYLQFCLFPGKKNTLHALLQLRYWSQYPLGIISRQHSSILPTLLLNLILTNISRGAVYQTTFYFLLVTIDPFEIRLWNCTRHQVLYFSWHKNTPLSV